MTPCWKFYRVTFWPLPFLKSYNVDFFKNELSQQCETDDYQPSLKSRPFILVYFIEPIYLTDKSTNKKIMTINFNNVLLSCVKANHKFLTLLYHFNVESTWNFPIRKKMRTEKRSVLIDINIAKCISIKSDSHLPKKIVLFASLKAL